MNQKELGELRRRLRPDKCAIKCIYGCYVNGNKEIVSYLDESLGRMSEEEADKYLSLLKKTMSGTLGRNLVDVVFSTEQVMDSDEYRLLSALRESELKSGEIREEFYRKVIDSLDMGDLNYVILLAYDAYDVPTRTRNDEPGDSDTVYRYILCGVCPVKDGKLELGYFPGENEFHSCVPGQIVAQPELGFLFPAFDDRAANIYNVLFYTKSAGDVHQDFLDGVFRAEPPMSADEQKEAFESALTSALADSCRLEVVQALHEQLREKIEAHRENKDPDAPSVTAREVEDILLRQGGGVGVPCPMPGALWRKRRPEPGKSDRQQALPGKGRRGHRIGGPRQQLPGGDPGDRRRQVPAHSLRKRRGGQRPARIRGRRSAVRINTSRWERRWPFPAKILSPRQKTPRSATRDMVW